MKPKTPKDVLKEALEETDLEHCVVLKLRKDGYCSIVGSSELQLNDMAYLKCNFDALISTVFGDLNKEVFK